MEGRYNFSLLRKHILKGDGIKMQSCYDKHPIKLYIGDTINHIKLWFKYSQYDWWNNKKFLNGE